MFSIKGQPGAPPHAPYPQMPYAPPQPYLHNIGFSGAPQSFGMPMPNSGMHYTAPYPSQYPPPPAGQYPQQGAGYPQPGGGYPQQGAGYPQQGSGYPAQPSSYPSNQGYPSQGGYPSANESSHQYSNSYAPPPSHGASYPGQQSTHATAAPKKVKFVKRAINTY